MSKILPSFWGFFYILLILLLLLLKTAKKLYTVLRENSARASSPHGNIITTLQETYFGCICKKNCVFAEVCFVFDGRMRYYISGEGACLLQENEAIF